jgi:transcriptional regulator with XRE-family HTH domain
MESEKLIGRLVDQTIRKYGLVGKELAKKANISETHLSQFRNGKTHIGDDKLAALLDGMEELAPGSRIYFCQQLSGESLNVRDFLGRMLREEEGLEELIDSMDLIQLSLLMDIATAKLRSQVSQSQSMTSAHMPMPA